MLPAFGWWMKQQLSVTGNGCMRVIPGSHQGGIVEHGKSAQAGNLLAINQEAAVTEEDEPRAVDLVLKSGELSIHDGKVMHNSLPNRSTRRRCGLTIRYAERYSCGKQRAEAHVP